MPPCSPPIFCYSFVFLALTIPMKSHRNRFRNRKVCTRNDDLEDVISRTPPARREDLVFLQNGVLGPLLEKHGLAKNTQVCLTLFLPVSLFHSLLPVG